MKKALFLDRDGVININHGYVHRIEDFDFVDGIFELCDVAQRQGYQIIIVTNQAGIGRGYYTEADFQTLMGWMLQQFKGRGITITAVYHCPYHPEHGVGEYKRASEDRKPNPGMLLRAKEEYDIDMATSVMIGDKETDVDAGKNAKVGTTILLDGSSGDTNADYQIGILRDAIMLLTR